MGNLMEFLPYHPDQSPEIIKIWRQSVRDSSDIRSVYLGREWCNIRHDIEHGVVLAAMRENNVAHEFITPLKEDREKIRILGIGKRLRGYVNYGAGLLIPETEQDYEKFFKEIFAKRGVKFFRCYLSTQDKLVKYLSNSKNDAWIVDKVEFKSRDYQWIDLRMGEEAYWGRFKKKQRYNLDRELKKIEQHGKINFERITHAEEIDHYVKIALPLAKKSWQRQFVGRNVDLVDEVNISKILCEACNQNVMRSYLLSIGDEPVGYWTGFQINNIFCLYDTGYDQNFSQFSPGKVMLQLIIKDLFSFNCPNTLSFGVVPDDYPYKSWFCTDKAGEVEVLLFKNTLLNRVASRLRRMRSTLKSDRAKNPTSFPLVVDEEI